MHAIHHSVATAQRESNYSSGLAIWDRLHRTARFDADADEVTVGVAEHLHREDAGLRRILQLPFRAG
jgi:sterol desaturase/sphingolipid hydroxylase (fatty acid hydroxylase superfamily)